MERHDSYLSNGLEYSIASIAEEARTEDGQDMSAYHRGWKTEMSIDMARIYVGFQDPSELVTSFFPDLSTIREMHARLSRLALEREVEISELTLSFLVFACLAYLRWSEDWKRAKQITDDFVRRNLIHSISESTENVGPKDVYFVQHVHPDRWDYGRHGTEYNWKTYEESLKSSMNGDDEVCGLVGQPL